MGFKDFTAGEVLTASDVDNFLMRQTVMVFDDSAARGSALGTLVTEGMVTYRKDVDLLEFNNGTEFRAINEPQISPLLLLGV